MVEVFKGLLWMCGMFIWNTRRNRDATDISERKRQTMQNSFDEPVERLGRITPSK